MKVQKTGSNVHLVLPVILILTAAILAGFVHTGSNQVTGAQVTSVTTKPIAKNNFVGANCDYVVDDGNVESISDYASKNPGKTGDDYCKSIGYDYSAFMTFITQQNYKDSSDGSCSGLTQLSLTQERNMPGHYGLVVESPTACLTNNAASDTEPEYGDVYYPKISTIAALCCEN